MSTSTEKPILFSGEMVRAILAGTKTVTRRVIKPQPPLDEHGNLDCGRILGPEMYHPVVIGKGGEMEPGEAVYGVYDDNGEWGVKCPYGRPGGLLGPRTTWAVLPKWDNYKPSEIDPEAVSIWFWFAGSRDKPEGAGKSRPGRFLPKTLWHYMPRLRVTAVRVERVQEITGAGVLSEGVNSHVHPSAEYFERAQRDAFSNLWDFINGKRGYGWNVNPWVFVIEFEKV